MPSAQAAAIVTRARAEIDAADYKSDKSTCRVGVRVEVPATCLLIDRN
jgi:phosphoenolpyruvate-protein kinase (PTS system EI component)